MINDKDIKDFICKLRGHKDPESWKLTRDTTVSCACGVKWYNGGWEVINEHPKEILSHDKKPKGWDKRPIEIPQTEIHHELTNYANSLSDEEMTRIFKNASNDDLD